MKITDAGELTSYETPPTECLFHISIISYSNGVWFAGPGDYDKEKLFGRLQDWIGVKNARIYSVKVPTITE
jgi:hypothetical protein